LVAGFGLVRADGCGFEGKRLTDEAFGDHAVLSLGALDRVFDYMCGLFGEWSCGCKLRRIGRPGYAVWISEARMEGAFRFLRQHASPYHDNRLSISMR